MSFEDFLKKFHPHTFVEYERSLVAWDDIKPGVIVVTLRSGFGGWPGLFKRVTEYHEKNEQWECKHIESLEPNRDGNMNVGVLMRHSADWRDEHWWQCVAPIDNYEHIITLPSRGQYIEDIVEGRRVK